MNKERTNSTVVLVVYQIIYVITMLWIVPILGLGETLEAAITAAMTVTSAVLIGKTFIEERDNGNLRRSLSTLALCTLITVYVLYERGLYS